MTKRGLKVTNYPVDDVNMIFLKKNPEGKELLTEYLSHKLLVFLSKKLQIDDSESDLYELGIEVIISTVFTSVCIMLIGGMLDHLAEAFLFLGCFITLRNYSGGYHAKTRTGCFATSIASYMAAEVIMSLVSRISGDGLSVVLGIGCLVVIAIFYFIAPLENPNKRLKPEWKKHNRRMTFIILSVWIGCGMLGMGVGAISIACQIWATLVVVSFLLWIARR